MNLLAAKESESILSTKASKEGIIILSAQLVSIAPLVKASPTTASLAVVSTESEEVKEVCIKYPDILIHNRPEHLLKDADTVDVYVDVMKTFDGDDITHVVGLQPDNPDRSRNLDEILEYFVTKKYDDLVTVGVDGTRNGSVRVIKSLFVILDNVSRRVGSLQDDCTNIHNQKDLEIATERLLKRNENA